MSIAARGAPAVPDVKSSTARSSSPRSTGARAGSGNPSRSSTSDGAAITVELSDPGRSADDEPRVDRRELAAEHRRGRGRVQRDRHRAGRQRREVRRRRTRRRWGKRSRPGRPGALPDRRASRRRPAARAPRARRRSRSGAPDGASASAPRIGLRPAQRARFTAGVSQTASPPSRRSRRADRVPEIARECRHSGSATCYCAPMHSRCSNRPAPMSGARRKKRCGVPGHARGGLAACVPGPESGLGHSTFSQIRGSGQWAWAY